MQLISKQKSYLFFTIFCCLLLALSFFNIYTSYHVAKNNLKQQLNNDSYLISEWIKGGFKSSDYVLRDIISQVSPTELVYPTLDQAQHSQRKVFLEQKRATLDHAILVSLFDENCIVTHSNSFDGFDASEREYCKLMKAQSQRNTMVSHALLSNSGQINVTQVRKFNSDEKGFIGMAAIAVNLDFFSQLIGSLSYGDSSIVSIFDTRMTLLSRRPKLPHLIGSKISQQDLRQFIDNKISTMYLEVATPIDGVERLNILKKIDGLPFVVIIGEATTDWQADWRHQSYTTLISLSLILVLAMFALKSYHSLNFRKERFKHLKTKAELLARTDSLTKVPNRLALFERGNSEFIRHKRYGNRLSVMMLDIDHFKRVNDTYGHPFGDMVLRSLGDIFMSSLRDCDTVGRIGGEEFVILLPENNLAQAEILAQRLRQTIEQHQFSTPCNSTSITISIGLAQASNLTDSFQSLLKNADQALYIAKNNGRNQVVSAPNM